MKIRESLIKLLIPIIAFVFILSCEYDVPVAEMTAARAAIEDVKKFDAEKNAPEEMKKAESLLLQSHEFLTNNKTGDAKKAANDALAAAREAETKSLPLFAAEQIKKSDEAYAAADQAYSEKFSPEKFTEAGTLIVEAKSSYEKNDYKKSAESSLKAYDLSVAARDESLQSSSVVEKEVTSAENKLSELKGDQFSSAAEGNLANAGTSIDNAKKGMESKDYKTSLKEIETAKKELEAAAELIKKQKITASIESLRAEVKTIQDKEGSYNIKEDLDNAILELNGAESALEQNNITDAELKVEQAQKLISGSSIKMKKESAIAAVERAEKLLVQAREKDAENKHKENLDKADTVILQAKSANEAENYNDGLVGAEEAESIINAVLNSMDTAASDMAVKSDTGQTTTEADAVTETKTDTKTEDTTVAAVDKKEVAGKTYVVKWRKKNTDCLWRIAQTVYKDASYWPAIYLANKDQIKDPDLIFPGQKFIIPPKPQKKPSYKKIKEQIKADSK